MLTNTKKLTQSDKIKHMDTFIHALSFSYTCVLANPGFFFVYFRLFHMIQFKYKLIKA